MAPKRRIKRRRKAKKRREAPRMVPKAKIEKEVHRMTPIKGGQAKDAPKEGRTGAAIKRETKGKAKTEKEPRGRMMKKPTGGARRNMPNPVSKVKSRTGMKIGGGKDGRMIGR